MCYAVCVCVCVCVCTGSVYQHSFVHTRACVGLCRRNVNLTCLGSCDWNCLQLLLLSFSALCVLTWMQLTFEFCSIDKYFIIIIIIIAIVISFDLARRVWNLVFWKFHPHHHLPPPPPPAPPQSKRNENRKHASKYKYGKPSASACMTKHDGTSFWDRHVRFLREVSIKHGGKRFPFFDGE